VAWNDPDALSQAMVLLLQDEAEALRGADFARLEALADSKEHLIRRAAAALPDAQAAEGIRRLAQRNAALMEGAMDGLRAAMAGLAAARAPAPPLNTYDGSGRRHALDRGSAVTSHRA
jgi:hypothetical protein